MGEETERRDREEIHRRRDEGKETELTDSGEERQGNLQKRRDRRRRERGRGK